MNSSRFLLFLGVLGVLAGSVLAQCEPEKVPDCVAEFMPKPMDPKMDQEAHEDYCMNVTNALHESTGIEKCRNDFLKCAEVADKKEAFENMTTLIDSSITSLEAQDQVCHPGEFGCDYTKLSMCYHGVFEKMDIDLPESMDDFTIDFNLFLKNLTKFCSKDVLMAVNDSLDCAGDVYKELKTNCTKIFEGVMDPKIPNQTTQPKPDMGIVGEKLSEFEPPFFKNMSMLVCKEGCPDLDDRHTAYDKCEMDGTKEMKMNDVIEEIITKDEEKHSVTESCGKHKKIVDCQKKAVDGCPALVLWMNVTHRHNIHAQKAMDICSNDSEKAAGDAHRLVPAVGALLLILMSLIVCL